MSRAGTILNQIGHIQEAIAKGTEVVLKNPEKLADAATNPKYFKILNRLWKAKAVAIVDAVLPDGTLHIRFHKTTGPGKRNVLHQFEVPMDAVEKA